MRTRKQLRQALDEMADREYEHPDVFECSRVTGACSVLAMNSPEARGMRDYRADGYRDMEDRAAIARPCPKHQPYKRLAWLRDVTAAGVAWAHRQPGAFAIHELRKFLPEGHPERA